MNNVDWEMVANAVGCETNTIPKDLIEILTKLDDVIVQANPDMFGAGLRSSQIVSLVVVFWQAGIIKGAKK